MGTMAATANATTNESLGRDCDNRHWHGSTPRIGLQLNGCRWNSDKTSSPNGITGSMGRFKEDSRVAAVIADTHHNAPRRTGVNDALSSVLCYSTKKKFGSPATKSSPDWRATLLGLRGQKTVEVLSPTSDHRSPAACLGNKAACQPADHPAWS